MSTATQYREKDFAVATIEGKTENNQSLKNILLGTGLHMIHAVDLKLPSLNESNTTMRPVNVNAPFNNAQERLFMIGLASEAGADLSHGMAISTTLTRNGPTNAPRRSFADDENIKTPPNINSRPEEDASSLASYPGMSGGPILRCKLDPSNPGNKKCAVIGTNFGAERVFNTVNILTGFKNFINKLLP